MEGGGLPWIYKEVGSISNHQLSFNTLRTIQTRIFYIEDTKIHPAADIENPILENMDHKVVRQKHSRDPSVQNAPHTRP